jgi:glycine/D-amino acid oxidase-like deaminating enzyme
MPANSDFEQLGQDTRWCTCDVLVVGAGLVGAAVAAKLVTEGLNVAVLEPTQVIGGATERAVGLVPTGLPIPFAQAVQQYERSVAQALWQLTIDNRASLTSAADRLGIELERPGSLILATSPVEADLLQSSAKLLSEDGIAAEFQDRDPLGRGFAAALYYPDDVVVDSAALAKRLFEAHRVAVRTGSEVYALQQAGDDVLVLAHGSTIKVSTVVLTVDAYAPLIDAYFADKIAPVCGYTLTTYPLDQPLASTPGSAGPFSFRQRKDGRLVFTAQSRQYEIAAAGPGEDSTEIDLMRFVGRHFPEARREFAQREPSIMGMSADGLPLIGALPLLPQVFFAVGFAGLGLSLAFAAADLLTGLIVRGAEPELLSDRRLDKPR